MRFKALAIMGTTGLLVIAASMATGHGRIRSVPTGVGVESTGVSKHPNRWVLSAQGRVDSIKKCRRSRRMSLYFKRPGHPKTVKDRSRSSRRGVWALSGRAKAPPHRVLVRVSRKRIRWHQRPRVCSGNQRAVQYVRP
jgi:hypothetical protein